MEADGGTLEINLRDVLIGGELAQKLGIKPGNYIELKVSDTGTGMPAEILDSIFEPYFTTKDPGEGTGLGLAVVHGIVEKYEGKITVDSKLDKGSVFTIYLPITKKPEMPQQFGPEDLPTGTERILFVDDEEVVANISRRILEQLGYTVTTRTNSLEALKLFNSKSADYDLVITDMTMPNMTGDKLATELMNIRSDIPVILCTGFSKNISKEAAHEMGIKAFVTKPIAKADIARIVRKVLDEAKGVAHI
jgi:CheY-like chemotaxis protein